MNHDANQYFYYRDTPPRPDTREMQAKIDRDREAFLSNPKNKITVCDSNFGRDMAGNLPFNGETDTHKKFKRHKR